MSGGGVSNDALRELSNATYWDERYAQEKNTNAGPTTGREEEDGTTASQSDTEGELGSFEWFRTFEQIQGFLEEVMPPPEDQPDILHLGCGNSTLPADLHALMYRNQLSVDFSQVVIDAMSTKYLQLSGLSWAVMDVRALTLPDSSIDIAIDKATLDAMIHGSLWDPPAEVRENVGKYVDEVARVLRGNGGKWIYITYRQPHFIRPLIVREGIWSAECKVLGGQGEGMLEYFGWVMTMLGENNGENVVEEEG